MNPICIASFCFELGLELELGSLFLAGVGAMAALLHHGHQKAQQEQRERHHREMCAVGAARYRGSESTAATS